MNKWGILQEKQLKKIQEKIQSNKPLTHKEEKLFEQWKEKERIEQERIAEKLRIEQERIAEKKRAKLRYNDCKQYESCLSKHALSNTHFFCAKCPFYSKQTTNVEDTLLNISAYKCLLVMVFYGKEQEYIY